MCADAGRPPVAVDCERVPPGLLDGRRHGVIVATDDGIAWRRGARTRRGARRSYLDLIDVVVMDPARAGAAPGDDVTVVRVERSWVVEEQQLHLPGEPPPDIGVREPRRPPPWSGGAAAVAPEL
jgi:hypothetical protein